MGCSASKRQPDQTDQNLAPFSRSLSLPGSRGKENGGSPSATPWKSCGTVTAAVDEQHSASQQVKSFSRLKPVRERDFIRRSTSPNETVCQKVCVGDHNRNDSSMSKLMETQAMCADSRGSLFRVSQCMDGSTGLRLLLSPAAIPSRSFASPARIGTLSKALASSCGYALSQSIDNARPENKQATWAVKVMLSQLEEMGDSEDVGSPIFDPSILATFEKALEASSEDNWPSDNATSSRCSRVCCLSSDITSDAENLFSYKESSIHQRTHQSLARQIGIEDKLFEVGDYDFSHGSNAFSRKKPSSKVIPLSSDAWISDEYLQAFDMKCPPGCEDKIVLYFTSLRGVRKTYEECCAVRLILKGFGVQVDERDVWMHSSFRQELMKVVGASMVVPRVFVRGRYIGGFEDIRHLHEEGILRHLLDGLPAEPNRKCTTCAGIRFIPCTSCNGSCKLISFREVSRCPDCNENGLMMCPSCY